MRHSVITLAMDTYGHLFPGQEAETVARLPDLKRPAARGGHGNRNLRPKAPAGTPARSAQWARSGDQRRGVARRRVATSASKMMGLISLTSCQCPR